MERIERGTNPTENIVGFRFHPTDAELIWHYLDGKNGGCQDFENIIKDVKICDHEPSELPAQAKIKSTEDRQWYFFSKPDLKYPNCRTGKLSTRNFGLRNRKPLTKRNTKSGSWKPTGVDREIKKNGKTIGFKKTLVFRKQGHKKRQKSNWVMHEYHSLNVFTIGTPYVVCKVKFKDDNDVASSTIPPYQELAGLTTNGCLASSSHIPSQGNHGSYQPAADQSILDFEKVDFEKETWSNFLKMLDLDGCYSLREKKHKRREQ